MIATLAVDGCISDPNRPTGRGTFRKLALTRITDPNRSTSVNFIHVNGRSLYIIDRLTAVVERRKAEELPMSRTSASAASMT